MEKRKKKTEEEEEEQAAAAWASFPSDLHREVLSRVPYRSLCSFKCVSREWLALCSDPAVRKRSPQTLSGFFCLSRSGPLSVQGIRFLNLSGRGQPMVDPSLPFLRDYGDVVLLNCCGGILLCSGWDRTMERGVYLVCNPATKEIWAALPVPDTQNPGAPFVYGGDHDTYLCFDPAVPGRFAVFLISHIINAVDVYSTDTGEWTSMVSGWGHDIELLDNEPGGIFFFNGTLHFSAYYCWQDSFDSEGNRIDLLIPTLDTDSGAWRTIQMPAKAKGFIEFIGQSQGRLHVMQLDHDNDGRISVWVLQDYASGQWTLKHSLSIFELLGRPCRKPGEVYCLVSIHPERSLLFLAGGVKPEETLMSYDMDNNKLNVICSLEEYDMRTFHPYTPCFAEWSSA
uniref:Uncharacterized protein n=1 Tax=Avena sativa TaxID=4498 RepID=A0ACD6A6P8_AVESA